LKADKFCEAYMANVLEQAINADDGDRAANIIRQALGIESDDVANYAFPKTCGRPTASSAPASSASGYRRGTLPGLG
jgi:hypothetical protein